MSPIARTPIGRNSTNTTLKRSNFSNLTKLWEQRSRSGLDEILKGGKQQITLQPFKKRGKPVLNSSESQNCDIQSGEGSLLSKDEIKK
jgi:hypothetical protein